MRQTNRILPLGKGDVELGETSKSTPELPENWEVKKDAFGRKYYYNAKTKQASWEPPTIVWFTKAQGKPTMRTLLNNDQRQSFFKDVYKKLSKELESSGIGTEELPTLSECHKVIVKLQIKEYEYEPILRAMLFGDQVDDASVMTAGYASPRRIKRSTNRSRERKPPIVQRRPHSAAPAGARTTKARNRAVPRRSRLNSEEASNRPKIDWETIGREKVHQYCEKKSQQLEAAKQKRELLASEFGSILTTTDTEKSKMFFNVTEGTYAPWPKKERPSALMIPPKIVLKDLKSPKRDRRLQKLRSAMGSGDEPSNTRRRSQLPRRRRSQKLDSYSQSPRPRSQQRLVSKSISPRPRTARDPSLSAQSRPGTTGTPSLSTQSMHLQSPKPTRAWNEQSQSPKTLHKRDNLGTREDEMDPGHRTETSHHGQATMDETGTISHANAFYHGVPASDYDFTKVLDTSSTDDEDNESDEAGHKEAAAKSPQNSMPLNKKQLESFNSMVFSQEEFQEDGYSEESHSLQPVCIDFDEREQVAREFQDAIEEASATIEQMQQVVDRDNPKALVPLSSSNQTQGDRDQDVSSMSSEAEQGWEVDDRDNSSDALPEHSDQLARIAAPREFELLQKLNHAERSLVVVKEERDRAIARESRWISQVERYREYHDKLNSMLAENGISMDQDPSQEFLADPIGSPRHSNTASRVSELLSRLHEVTKQLEASNIAREMTKRDSQEATDRVASLVQELKEHKIALETQQQVIQKLRGELKESRDLATRHETTGREIEAALDLERFRRTRDQEAASVAVQHLEKQVHEAEEIASQYESFYLSREMEGTSGNQTRKGPDEKYQLLRKLREQTAKQRDMSQTIIDLTNQLEMAQGQILLYRDQAKGAVDELISFKHNVEASKDETTEMVMQENVELKQKEEKLRREVEQCVVHLKLGRSALSDAKKEQDRLRAEISSLKGEKPIADALTTPTKVVELETKSQVLEPGEFSAATSPLDIQTYSSASQDLTKAQEWYALRQALEHEHELEIRRVKREAASIAASTVAHSRIEREVQMENIRAKFMVEISNIRQETAKEVDLLNHKHAKRVEEVHAELESIVSKRMESARDKFAEELKEAIEKEHHLAEENVNELNIQYEKELLRVKQSSGLNFLRLVHQRNQRSNVMASFMRWRNNYHRAKSIEVADLFGTAVDRIDKATGAGKLAVLLNRIYTRSLSKAFRLIASVASSEKTSTLLALVPSHVSTKKSNHELCDESSFHDGVVQFSENIERIIETLRSCSHRGIEECFQQMGREETWSAGLKGNVFLSKETLIRCLKRSCPELTLAEIDIAVSHIAPGGDLLNLPEVFEKILSITDGQLAFYQIWHELESRRLKCTAGAAVIRNLFKRRKISQLARAFRKWNKQIMKPFSIPPLSPFNRSVHSSADSVRYTMERHALEEEVRSLHTQLQEAKSDVWKYKRKLISQFEKNSVELLRHHQQQHSLHRQSIPSPENDSAIAIPNHNPVVPALGHSSSWGSSSTTSFR